MKRLFLASLAAVAMMSCAKESYVDPAIAKSDLMSFAPYAGVSTTRGDAVSNNVDFRAADFNVAAYSGAEKYFGFNTVSYAGGKWNNTDMYWPNAASNLHFGAYYPASSIPATGTGAATYEYKYGETNPHLLKFDYKVADAVADQKDIMYALADLAYAPPTADVDNSVARLHFKHALTQVHFTATKSDDISVTVTSLKVCNIIDNGSFEATMATGHNMSGDLIVGDQNEPTVNHLNFGSWTPAITNDVANYHNYVATMSNTAGVVVNSATVAVPLTSQDDVMMLLPQALTNPWNATDKTQNNGFDSYLAIGCKITHNDGVAPIVEGTVYVPFETKDIAYRDGAASEWKPGYKVTYNLNFGGGYTKPGGGEDPEPGKTPNPDEVIPTLRLITYDVTVDDWMPVSGGSVGM